MLLPFPAPFFELSPSVITEIALGKSFFFSYEAEARSFAPFRRLAADEVELPVHVMRRLPYHSSARTR